MPPQKSEVRAVSIILASASPRRRELLTLTGREEFYLMAPRVSEELEGWKEPWELVSALARRKAEAAAKARARAIDTVIAADTIVWLEGRALGKPAGRAEALEMLEALSGREHTVYTGVCVYKNGEYNTKYEATRVFFRELSREEIMAYIETGEPMDKAGAYGVQGRACVFVRRIEGDYFNVMGLPVCLLDSMLREIGE